MAFCPLETVFSHLLNSATNISQSKNSHCALEEGLSDTGPRPTCSINPQLTSLRNRKSHQLEIRAWQTTDLPELTSYLFIHLVLFYIFGRFSENISHSSSVPQAVIQHGDDAHQEGVARSLYVVLICKHT